MKIKKDYNVVATALANAVCVVAGSSAIGYAIKRTGSAFPLLAFPLIPTFSYKRNNEDNSNEEKTHD